MLFAEKLEINIVRVERFVEIVDFLEKFYGNLLLA